MDRQEAVSDGLISWARNVHRTFESFGTHTEAYFRHITTALQHNLGSHAHNLFENVQSVILQPTRPYAFASLTSAHRSQPIADVAFHPDEIKKLLSGIPIYAVVNQKEEFVLASGEDTSGRQLGLFFFNRGDAEEFLDSVNQEDAKLAKNTKILTTSMEQVYDFAIRPRSASDTEGVIFRFMPAAEEVEAALNLCRASGVNNPSFAGVPVFQAEGLTVSKEGGAKFTPLFFSKSDLDWALGSAVNAREDEAQAAVRAKTERVKTELSAAENGVSSASDLRAKRIAQKKVEGLKKRLAKYEAQMETAKKQQKTPRIDVGCLEDVLTKMESDETGEWSDIIFVAAGTVAPTR